MANIKSAKKRAHQAIGRRAHNMKLRTAVRTAIKNVVKAVAAGDKDTAAK
jgi:small subunit ribosomal protein S20